MDDTTVEESYPWPERGDLPLVENGGFSSACLNFSRNSWFGYIKGYKRGADILIQHAIVNRGDLDTLVFPIVFMYRHYLELQLKDLIQTGNRLLGRKGSYKTSHRLESLWQACRLVLQDMPLGPSADDLDTLQDCIHQFVQVDPTSTAFRYPVDKDGSSSLPNMRLIDLPHLFNVMEKIGWFFDAADAMISAELESKMDMEYYTRTWDQDYY